MLKLSRDLINLFEIHPYIRLTTYIYLFQSDQYVVPSIFVYGHTATGKSLVISAIMTAMQVNA